MKNLDRLKKALFVAGENAKSDGLTIELCNPGKDARQNLLVVKQKLLMKMSGATLYDIDYRELLSCIYPVNHRNTEGSNSKLNGGMSISSEVHTNKLCMARMEQAMREIEEFGETNIICASCYAESMQRQYSGLSNRNEINAIILENFAIPERIWAEFPTISEFMRANSFSDVQTVTECINYLRWMRTHSWLPGAIWSKNPKYWAEAFAREGKPENVTYIHSSLRENVIEEVPKIIREYCDHRFTVFTKEYLAEHQEVKINCGGRQCRTCMTCYHKGTEFDIFEIKK